MKSATANNAQSVRVSPIELSRDCGFSIASAARVSVIMVPDYIGTPRGCLKES